MRRMRAGHRLGLLRRRRPAELFVLPELRREGSERMSERGDTGRSCAFYTADYLRRCVDLSWDMEIDRYESLSRTACVITISAPLAAASVVGFSFGSSQHVKTVCVFAVLVLCVSFALALFALLRHRYDALDSPGVFADYVGRYESDFDDDKDAMIQLALTRSTVSLSEVAERLDADDGFRLARMFDRGDRADVRVRGWRRRRSFDLELASRVSKVSLWSTPSRRRSARRSR